jgi:hypothetical protein
MSSVTQEEQKVKCDYDDCHEPIFREGHCWEHFLKEKMDEWDAQDAERQTCLEGVGYVFGDSLDTGWLAEEVCR